MRNYDFNLNNHTMLERDLKWFASSETVDKKTMEEFLKNDVVFSEKLNSKVENKKINFPFSTIQESIIISKLEDGKKSNSVDNFERKVNEKINESSNVKEFLKNTIIKENINLNFVD